MIILGCDTSTKTAHLFLGEYKEERLVWHESTSVVWNNTHSERLLNRLLRMCSDHSIELSELDLLCASSGPGSFTGLRIALATMKGLALGLNKPLVSVPTLDLFQ
ncbi:MAG: tRNA (adenosine(37)-N6)-threonylcarbamoyltransferase complex dimerization subunit type 1 TsaB, partial [Spirochaetales bacterium]|nr:tRNA (adenosine(37)-N6)-threonylcarbamoyltransferase complex dimerization subunit type 1 TsaB [Spirochaetales bacterium]